jgi:hypothetical protein
MERVLGKGARASFSTFFSWRGGGKAATSRPSIGCAAEPSLLSHHNWPRRMMTALGKTISLLLLQRTKMAQREAISTRMESMHLDVLLYPLREKMPLLYF